MKKVERIIKNCLKCNKSFETRQKLINIGKGKYCSISCARKDHSPIWMHINYEGRGKKIGESIKKGNWTEERSSAWKGERVSYYGLHMWVRKNLGSAKMCEDCGKQGSGHSMHWANISKQYKRDLSDWKQLCPKCHAIFDGRRKNYEA